MSPVNRYHVRVFHLGHQKGAWETELDLNDEARLRDLLTEAADDHNPTRKVRDYAEWTVEVCKYERQRADLKGPRLARVGINGSGRTVVTRW